MLNQKEAEHRRRAQADWESAAPERERARLAAEAMARATGDAQRRRQNARDASQWLYSLHAPEIASRYPRRAFKEFITKYLGDDHPPEYVEQRAHPLQEIIRHYLEKMQPTVLKKSLADLAGWYLEEKAKIECLPMNPADQEQILANLDARHLRLQEEHIRSMKP